MTVPATRPDGAARRLTEMADYVVPFVLRAVGDLGVADHLVAGPLPVHVVAERTGTHPRALLRALRALAAREVFSEVDDEVFALTELAEPLRSDHPRSLRDAYPLIAADVAAWAHLHHSLRTGEAAFDEVHGTDYWTYLARDPEVSARFDASQRAVTLRESATLLSAYDWSRFGTVVDVGGGNGTFLAALLAAFPRMRGTVLDQPHVVSGAPSVLEAGGVADRATVVGGDFRVEVPAGGDVYVVKRAFYDLGDDDALAVLRAVRAVVPPEGRLLVVEPVVEAGDGFEWGKLYDLLLLTMRGGGSRTSDEHAALLDQAGFSLVAVHRTRGLPIVEARPV